VLAGEKRPHVQAGPSWPREWPCSNGGSITHVASWRKCALITQRVVLSQKRTIALSNRVPSFFSLMPRLKASLLGASAAIGWSLLFSTAAQANLVQNGDFENSTPNNVGTWPTSAGGIGQIDNIVTLANWTKTSVVNDGSDGFAFVINQDADNRTPGSSYPNQGGGFPSKFSNTASPPTNIFLWGPDYGPNPQNNGFTGPSGSSASNKFIGADGDYGASILSQVISGLDTSKQYILSYDYAGAQETGEQGATNQQWKVALGGTDYSTPVWINPSRGFTAWSTFTSSAFTPLATSLTLTFESWGRAVTSGSLPPFLLLDNVKIVETTTPPPPTPSVPGPLPVIGVGLALGWSRKLRSRIAASTKD